MLGHAGHAVLAVAVGDDNIGFSSHALIGLVEEQVLEQGEARRGRGERGRRQERSPLRDKSTRYRKSPFAQTVVDMDLSVLDDAGGLVGAVVSVRDTAAQFPAS